MATHFDVTDPYLTFWRRVRAYAVPPTMIERATARRRTGDWAGACAAARVDADLDLRALARALGAETARRVRADLRVLAPDLLRWHLPRVGPSGLLRPDTTLTLARYGRLHLVVRTPPARADGGQRFSVALWQPGGSDVPFGIGQRPATRARLDLHRHLWDADRAPELRHRAGPVSYDETNAATSDGRWHDVDPGQGAHWAAEATLLRAADGLPQRARVLVRRARRRWYVLHDGPHGARLSPLAPTRTPAAGNLPVLPDAALHVPPDVLLLRHGLITAAELHPLVAAALAPDPAAGAGPRPAAPAVGTAPLLVECGGARHRVAVVDGVLTPLDHDPEELRREAALLALGGPSLACLTAIDLLHRQPNQLPDLAERLAHGDWDGALTLVERLLGPRAVLHEGPLYDAITDALRRRRAYGLLRAGLPAARGTGPGLPDRRDHRVRRFLRTHPRLDPKFSARSHR